jgi:hypothetical protein
VTFLALGRIVDQNLIESGYWLHSGQLRLNPRDFLVEEISDSSCVEQLILISGIRALIPRLKRGGVSFRIDASLLIIVIKYGGPIKKFHRHLSTIPFFK